MHSFFNPPPPFRPLSLPLNRFSFDPDAYLADYEPLDPQAMLPEINAFFEKSHAQEEELQPQMPLGQRTSAADSRAGNGSPALSHETAASSHEQGGNANINGRNADGGGGSSSNTSSAGSSGDSGDLGGLDRPPEAVGSSEAVGATLEAEGCASARSSSRSSSSSRPGSRHKKSRTSFPFNNFGIKI